MSSFDDDIIPLEFFKGDRTDRKFNPVLPDTKMDLSLCSTEYILDNDEAVVLLFCRDVNGNEYTIPVRGFRPYFYTESRYQEAISFGSGSGITIEQTSLQGYKTHLPLIKVYVRKPSDVAKLRSIKDPYRPRFSIPTWEADILFPLRYLIDNGIYTGITYDPTTGDIVPKDMPSMYRKLYIDIETWSYKNPDMINTPDPIIVIGLYDNFSMEYRVLSTKRYSDITLEDYLIQKDCKIRFTYCKDEKELLRNFVTYVSSIKPDVFLSFTKFDWLYILNRMKNLKMNEYHNMSRVGVVQIFGDGYKAKIHGLQFLDIQDMYYQVFLSGTGSKWETLHAIASKELGEEKLYREESVYDNWKNDPNRVILRNIRDVEIIRRLDEELALFTYFDTIRRTIGSNLSDTQYKSRIADVMFLRFCHNTLALPTKSVKVKENYEGGIVFNIDPGIYKNIVVFDWSSMYPSIVDAFNISFETWTRIPQGDSTYNIDGKYTFYRSPPGWAGRLMSMLNTIREPYKKKSKDNTLSKHDRLYNKAVSDGVKSVVNSIYGVFGQSGDEDSGISAYRLYLPEVASAITYVGRTIQQDGLKPICESLGYEIVYADTDSVFIKLKTDTLDKQKEETKFLENELGRRVKEFIKNRWDTDARLLELSFDKHYSILIFFSKKRYIGKRIDGEIDVRGLEIVRRNTADISGEAQLLVSNAIFDGRSREEIIQLIRDLIKGFKDKQLEEIAIAQTLTKEWGEYSTASGHVKAHMWSTIELGMNIPINKRFWTAYIIPDKIPSKYKNYIIWKTKNKIKSKDKSNPIAPYMRMVDQVAWDEQNPLPDEIRSIIDYDTMLEKTVKQKIDLFLELLKIDWYNDIVSPRTTTGG